MTELEWQISHEPQAMLTAPEFINYLGDNIQRRRLLDHFCASIAATLPATEPIEIAIISAALATIRPNGSIDSSRQATYAELIRDLYGNIFQPGTLCGTSHHPGQRCPTCDNHLAWNHHTPEKIASSALLNPSQETLSILADALEDSGVTSQEVLAHCRQPDQLIVRCHHCSGHGYLFRDLLYGDTMTDPCDDCAGTGRITKSMLHTPQCWALRACLAY